MSDTKETYVKRVGDWLRIGSTALRVADIDRVFVHQRRVVIDRGAKGEASINVPDGAQDSDADALAMEIIHALAGGSSEAELASNIASSLREEYARAARSMSIGTVR
jgi:hypothetical protein